MRLFGLIAGTVGILCLMVALVFGIMIGVNDQTMNKYSDQDEDISEDDYNSSSESNAFLNFAARGLAGFGIGNLFIGIGLALAGRNHGNWMVIIIAAIALMILLAGLIVSFYMGAISRESEKIDNKEEPSADDIDREKDISNTIALLQPFNWFFSEFLFGSCGMGLALATILLGAFVMAGNGRKKERILSQQDDYEIDEDEEDDGDEDFDMD